MTQSNRFMKPLTSDIHLYTAQMDRSPIVVFAAGELVGSGRIAEVTENSVRSEMSGIFARYVHLNM